MLAKIAGYASNDKLLLTIVSFDFLRASHSIGELGGARPLTLLDPISCGRLDAWLQLTCCAADWPLGRLRFRCWRSLACRRGAQIVFDLPDAIECRDATPADFQAAHPALKVVEGKLRISARVIEGTEAEVVDFLYTIANPGKTMRFEDYLPNTLLESAVAEDQIEISDATENAKATGGEVHVAYKLFGIGLSHNQSAKKSEASRYKQIASKELVLASGTTNREHGVFFRLRPSRAASLEGAKEFTFLATVPKTWRGDVCTIACTARGMKVSFLSTSVAPAGAVRATVGVHLVGDAEAAALIGELRHAQEAHAAALAAFAENDSVLDTISSQTVGFFTHKKHASQAAIDLEEAGKALADAQDRLRQMAK